MLYRTPWCWCGVPLLEVILIKVYVTDLLIFIESKYLDGDIHS